MLHDSSQLSRQSGVGNDSTLSIQSSFATFKTGLLDYCIGGTGTQKDSTSDSAAKQSTASVEGGAETENIAATDEAVTASSGALFNVDEVRLIVKYATDRLGYDNFFKVIPNAA